MHVCPQQEPASSSHTAACVVTAEHQGTGTMLRPPSVMEAAVVAPCVIPARGAAPGRVSAWRRVPGLIPVGLAVRVSVQVSVGLWVAIPLPVVLPGLPRIVSVTCEVQS